MKTNKDKNISRLQQIILYDSFGIPNSVIEMLKSDIVKFMKNHFDIRKEEFSFDIKLNDEGKYEIKINFVANDIYQEKVVK